MATSSTSSTTSLCFPATSAAGARTSFRTTDTFVRYRRSRQLTRLKARKAVVRSDLDRDVSDMRTNGKLG